ncbi:MAG: SWIM zinc finger family protein [Candidatus Nanoarchaeia archaeon]|nr:SWIM zinc finger family protein [Candidatus Nanoarchaeia archaeon]MDD5239727.1 SWIM zinc finger family protein [Candidatus Nanoarchaeia archaeon]
MIIKIASEKSIEALKHNTHGSIDSGKRMINEVNVDYITAKHIGFSCRDYKYKTNHSVIYYSERPLEKAWNCDCKWSSLKEKFCGHILAVFLRLLTDEKFLKKFKKEAVDI